MSGDHEYTTGEAPDIRDQEEEVIAFSKDGIVRMRAVLNEANALFFLDLFPTEARELADQLIRAAHKAEDHKYGC